MGLQADSSHTLSKTEVAVSSTIGHRLLVTVQLSFFIAVFRTVSFHLEEILFFSHDFKWNTFE